MSAKVIRSARCLLAPALLALALALGGGSARADMVVVVANSHGSVSQLSRDDVVNVFMGRYRKLPDGSAAVPFDLDSDSPVRKSFYRRLLGKSLEEVNAYWARLIFAGRTTPPRETSGAAEMLERVAGDPHAVGYIDRSRLANPQFAEAARGVKVVFALPDPADR